MVVVFLVGEAVDAFMFLRVGSDFTVFCSMIFSTKGACFGFLVTVTLCVSQPVAFCAAYHMDTVSDRTVSGADYDSASI